MIDFRYHIISITAVLLALALGIAAGSGFLGSSLIDRLQIEARSQITENGELRGENEILRDDLRDRDDGVASLEPAVVDNTLAGRQFVMIQFADTDGALLEGLEQVVEEADGRVVTVIELTSAWRIESQDDANALATVVQTPPAGPETVRLEAAEALGSALGEAANPRRAQVRLGDGTSGVNDLLGGLENLGYVGIQRDDPGLTIPPSADFILAAGGAGIPPYAALGEMALELGTQLARRGPAVLAAETSESLWGLAEAVRSDGEASDVIMTVDNAEVPLGRISVALALMGAGVASELHFGTDAGAAAILPPTLAPAG